MNIHIWGMEKHVEKRRELKPPTGHLQGVDRYHSFSSKFQLDIIGPNGVVSKLGTPNHHFSYDNFHKLAIHLDF